MQANANRMREVFSEIWKDRSDRFTLLERGQANRVDPGEVLDRVRGMDIAGNDSIFFYYCGHGGWSANRGGNGAGSGEEDGHYLATSGGDLYRYELRRALLNRRLRAGIMITDCCSNIAGITPPQRRVPAEWQGFQDLFFRHRGLIDIQAATRGQFGWSSAALGGLFTNCFTKLLCEPRSAIRQDGFDGFVSWRDFFEKLRGDTVKLFNVTQENAERRTDGEADIKDYEPQTPQAFFLGEWPENEKYLLVKNSTGEPLCMWLKYYCHRDGVGWHWRGGDKGLYYELPAGAEVKLNETFPGGRWPVRAKMIRYRASTPTTQRARLEWNGWWNASRWIVPIGGYRAKGGDIDTWTLEIKF